MYSKCIWERSPNLEASHNLSFTPFCKQSILTTRDGFIELDKLNEDKEIKRFMTKGHALSYAENMYGDITLFDYMQEKELYRKCK